MSTTFGRRIPTSALMSMLAIATLLIGTAIPAWGAVPPVQRPNIVFIMADDLGYADLSATGSRHINTPAIDSIARDGVMLRQGYASTPICSPTRTALLTGNWAQRLPVGVEEPITQSAPAGTGIPIGQPTLASVLKSLGYRTALVGKWHQGELPDHGPLRHGYDQFFGITGGAVNYF